MFPFSASARPKGTWQSCNTQDPPNFGASCNDQMQQDIMGNKPTPMSLCGGETMLCCTVDNNTNQVINCRKPAGSRVMPGLQGNTLGAAGMAGVQRRGVESKAQDSTRTRRCLQPSRRMSKELRPKAAAK